MLKESSVSSIAKELGKAVIKESQPLFKGLLDEFKYFVVNGLEKYLDRCIQRFAYGKTFLHRSSPAFFYNYYYPLTLIDSEGEDKTDDIIELFHKYSRIAIVGDAGSGKSTLMKHFFITTICIAKKIPIYVEFRYIKGEGNSSIKKYIFHMVTDNKLSPCERIFERMLEAGKFTFFLDGFDEISPDIKSDLMNDLQNFSTRYDKNRFVITGRPNSQVDNYQSFQNHTVKSLDSEDVSKFIKQQPIEQELKSKMLDSIKGNQQKHVESFLRNPLLLSLYILAFRTNPTVPNKKSTFYRRVVDTLFTEHDSLSKLGFERKLLTGFSQDLFEDILKKFCFLSFMEAHYNFDKEELNQIITKVEKSFLPTKLNSTRFSKDMVTSISLWTEDDGVFSFSHRSIQEYFAALYISGLAHEKKDKVYSLLIKRLSVQNRNQAYNFLDLCEELDEVEYIRMFMLPCLINAINILDVLDPKEQIVSFLKNFIKKVVYYQGSKGENKFIKQIMPRYAYSPVLASSGIPEDLDYIACNNNILEHIIEKQYNRAETDRLFSVLTISYTLPIDECDVAHPLVQFLSDEKFDRMLKKTLKRIQEIKSNVEKRLAAKNDADENILDELMGG